jgi:hypothetical protein
MTSTTELEIVKATKVKEKPFKQRQDYLAALVRAIDKLGNDEWDNLSDEAVAWHTAAVNQMDKKRAIEDFEPPEPEVVENGPETDSPEFKEEEISTVEMGETLPLGGHTGTDDCVSNYSSDKTADAEKEIEKEEAPKRGSRYKATWVKEPKVTPERYIGLTGDKDKYGICIGTKTHEAVKMYERPEGASLLEIAEAIGGRHYNILTKLIKAGHKVKKLKAGKWHVTHKDMLKNTAAPEEEEEVND